MDHRAVLALAMLSGAVLIGSTFSCSAADPGTVNFSERPKGQTGDLTSGGTSGVTPADGGSSGTPEAGVDGGSTSGQPVTAFTGAPAYDGAGTANGTSLNGGHNFAGSTPVTNPVGQNCMDCHKAGGAAAGAIFGIAGTVFNTAAGAAPVAKAEVRIVDAAGKELSKVYSDVNGNFWSDTIVGGVPGGSKVGVRNATVTKLMSTALTTQDAGCQKAGCHVVGAATPGRIFLGP